MFTVGEIVEGIKFLTSQVSRKNGGEVEYTVLSAAYIGEADLPSMGRGHLFQGLLRTQAEDKNGTVKRDTIGIAPIFAGIHSVDFKAGTFTLDVRNKRGIIVPAVFSQEFASATKALTDSIETARAETAKAPKK